MNNIPADSSLAPEAITLLSADDGLHRQLVATGLIDDLRPIRTLEQLDGLLPALKTGCLFLATTPADSPLESLVSAVQARLPRCRLVALSSDDNSDHVVACLRAGADDFLSLRDPLQLHARLTRVLGHLQGSRPRRPMDRQFKTLADSAPALVWITDNTGEFIHFNRPWLAFTGRPPEAELGQSWLNGVFPEDRVRFSREFADYFQRREPFRVDFRLRRHDGNYRWITCQGIPHYEEDEFFTGCIGSCMDVTDQHEAETLLAYRAITQAALAGFGRFALGPHQVQEIKQEATRLVCDILQLNFSEVLLFDPPYSDTLTCYCSTGFPPAFVHPAMTAEQARAECDKCLELDEDAAIFPGRENHALWNVRSGLAIAIHIGDRTVGFITGLSVESRTFGREAVDFIHALATTISTVHQRAQAERTLQESEAKLLQSQKMEAIGQLAGGVAHDFNNLLTAVRCYGDMLHADLTDIAPHLKSKTGEILRAADRASALTRQLLAFSRKQVLQPETLDMNGIIVELRDLVRSLLSESVSLEVRFSDDAVCFAADRNQIDQVVLNLCLNARDAMPQGGILTLEIGTVHISSPDARNLPPGDYIQLMVGDTGVGMPPEVQARLFQPFFTTKPVGRGTGLGLATCAVIVKNCNGIITFDSTPGQGTRFTVFLPRIEPPLMNFFLEQEQQISSGRERILIVEDDEAIRQITFAILDSRGYRVTVVPGGDEALSLFKFDPPPFFDLLLTDVIMPEIDGLTLAGLVQARHPPGLRTLFMSGYLGSAETVQAVAEYNLPFLEKPFTLEGLTRKVREALDAPPADLPP
jgi:two-component system, cell cycle sensor histidine kinase and response regulator CckA